MILKLEIAARKLNLQENQIGIEPTCKKAKHVVSNPKYIVAFWGAVGTKVTDKNGSLKLSLVMGQNDENEVMDEDEYEDN